MDAINVSVEDEVLRFLISAPTLEQIITFRPSDSLQDRASWLMELNRQGQLSEAETRELDEFERMDHFVMRLKGYARLQMRGKLKP